MVAFSVSFESLCSSGTRSLYGHFRRYLFTCGQSFARQDLESLLAHLDGTVGIYTWGYGVGRGYRRRGRSAVLYLFFGWNRDRWRSVHCTYCCYCIRYFEFRFLSLVGVDQSVDGPVLHSRYTGLRYGDAIHRFSYDSQ